MQTASAAACDGESECSCSKVVITGGGGFVGFRLGQALAALGHQVVLLDLHPPSSVLPPGIKFVTGDVRGVAALERCFAGAHSVFHIASYGMSGRSSLQHRLIEEINVQGTQNVIHACLAAGVERLVYTSTYNVVFGGKPIVCGDESLPAYPPHLHPDTYSRTKALAEQKVLGANMAPLHLGSTASLGGGGAHLRTCVIRPAGIYGPGEQRHLPRVVRCLELGLFCFIYSDPGGSLVDFVHVDNLVQAHVLAAQGLGKNKEHVAAGQAYFISDGQPINNFEFFRPLVEGLGYQMPTLHLPLRLVYWVAFLTELLHRLVWRLYNFQPLLTRCEVLKTGVTHYFSIGKARRELGYEPQQYPFDPVIAWFKERGQGAHARTGGKWSATVLVWLAVAVIAVALALLRPLLSMSSQDDRAKLGMTSSSGGLAAGPTLM